MVFKLICPACSKQSVAFFIDFALKRITARCHCGHVQED